MQLRIVTPEGEKVQAEVTMVTAPGTLGELGILPGHRPLLTSLGIGELSYIEGGRTVYMATNKGYMEVHEDQLTIVTETAESADEIDISRAKKALDKANDRIAALDPRSQLDQYNMAVAKKKRAEARIKLAQQHATPEALRQVNKKNDAA